MAKTPEELEQERAEAAEKLNEILKASRPKNLGEGMSKGVSNVVAGAVGGAGIAVLGPTLGLAVGWRSGGLLGAVFGGTVGTMAGALGAAGMIIGGALSGVSQMVRGVAAVPGRLTGPASGKWWNDEEHEWVFTDMNEEMKKLDGVSEDDRDFLSEVQDEIDSETEKKTENVEVVDAFYYDVLEVDSKAEQQVIKRKYYLLAKKLHPDRNQDNPEAAEKFKDVAEAYQVLSDPTLRKKYDEEGRAGLSADKTEINDSIPKIDPAVMFAFLFGSDKFTDIYGRLATSTSASIGDSPKISRADARTLQVRRVIRLADKVIVKIQPYVDGDFESAKAQWKAEAEELVKTSYGYQLVSTIGKIYNLTAVRFLGSIESGIGVPSIAKWADSQRAAMDKSRMGNASKMDTLKAGFGLVQIQAELKGRLEKATTDEEKEAIKKEMEDKAGEILLQILWTTTVVDLTATLYETTNMVYHDQSVDKDTRKKRAEAVKDLGEVWMAIPEPEGLDHGYAKQMYEDAAFAAMVDAVKRKDESAQ